MRVNCNTVEIGKFNALNVNKTKVKECYYTYRCMLVPFSRRQSVNILHFWTSFPKPPDQIQLNLAQSTYVYENNGPHPFSKGEN